MKRNIEIVNEDDKTHKDRYFQTAKAFQNFAEILQKLRGKTIKVGEDEEVDRLLFALIKAIKVLYRYLPNYLCTAFNRLYVMSLEAQAPSVNQFHENIGAGKASAKFTEYSEEELALFHHEEVEQKCEEYFNTTIAPCMRIYQFYLEAIKQMFGTEDDPVLDYARKLFNNSSKYCLTCSETDTLMRSSLITPEFIEGENLQYTAMKAGTWMKKLSIKWNREITVPYFTDEEIEVIGKIHQVKDYEAVSISEERLRRACINITERMDDIPNELLNNLQITEFFETDPLIKWKSKNVVRNIKEKRLEGDGEEYIKQVLNILRVGESWARPELQALFVFNDEKNTVTAKLSWQWALSSYVGNATFLKEDTQSKEKTSPFGLLRKPPRDSVYRIPPSIDVIETDNLKQSFVFDKDKNEWEPIDWNTFTEGWVTRYDKEADKLFSKYMFVEDRQ